MFNQCIYFNLSTLNRQVTKIWQDQFVLVGLSPSHGYLLAAMATEQSASQKRLSEIMELDASTINRFIDALAAKKMIEKTSTGRGASFAVTPQGLKTVQKIETLMNDLVGNLHETLGKREFKSFVDHTREMKQSLEEAYA